MSSPRRAAVVIPLLLLLLACASAQIREPLTLDVDNELPVVTTTPSDLAAPRSTAPTPAGANLPLTVGPVPSETAATAPSSSMTPLTIPSDSPVPSESASDGSTPAASGATGSKAPSASAKSSPSDAGASVVPSSALNSTPNATTTGVLPSTAVSGKPSASIGGSGQLQPSVSAQVTAPPSATRGGIPSPSTSTEEGVVPNTVIIPVITGSFSNSAIPSQLPAPSLGNGTLPSDTIQPSLTPAASAIKTSGSAGPSASLKPSGSTADASVVPTPALESTVPNNTATTAQPSSSTLMRSIEPSESPGSSPKAVTVPEDPGLVSPPSPSVGTNISAVPSGSAKSSSSPADGFPSASFGAATIIPSSTPMTAPSASMTFLPIPSDSPIPSASRSTGSSPSVSGGTGSQAPSASVNSIVAKASGSAVPSSALNSSVLNASTSVAGKPSASTSGVGQVQPSVTASAGSTPAASGATNSIAPSASAKSSPSDADASVVPSSALNTDPNATTAGALPSAAVGGKPSASIPGAGQPQPSVSAQVTARSATFSPSTALPESPGASPSAATLPSGTTLGSPAVSNNKTSGSAAPGASLKPSASKADANPVPKNATATSAQPSNSTGSTRSIEPSESPGSSPKAVTVIDEPGLVSPASPSVGTNSSPVPSASSKSSSSQASSIPSPSFGAAAIVPSSTAIAAPSASMSFLPIPTDSPIPSASSSTGSPPSVSGGTGSQAPSPSVSSSVSKASVSAVPSSALNPIDANATTAVAPPSTAASGKPSASIGGAGQPQPSVSAQVTAPPGATLGGNGTPPSPSTSTEKGVVGNNGLLPLPSATLSPSTTLSMSSGASPSVATPPSGTAVGSSAASDINTNGTAAPGASLKPSASKLDANPFPTNATATSARPSNSMGSTRSIEPSGPPGSSAKPVTVSNELGLVSPATPSVGTNGSIVPSASAKPSSAHAESIPSPSFGAATIIPSSTARAAASASMTFLPIPSDSPIPRASSSTGSLPSVSGGTGSQAPNASVNSSASKTNASAVPSSALDSVVPNRTTTVALPSTSAAGKPSTSIGGGEQPQPSGTASAGSSPSASGAIGSQASGAIPSTNSTASISGKPSVSVDGAGPVQPSVSAQVTLPPNATRGGDGSVPAPSISSEIGVVGNDLPFTSAAFSPSTITSKAPVSSPSNVTSPDNATVTSPTPADIKRSGSAGQSVNATNTSAQPSNSMGSTRSIEPSLQPGSSPKPATVSDEPGLVSPASPSVGPNSSTLPNTSAKPSSSQADGVLSTSFGVGTIVPSSTATAAASASMTFLPIPSDSPIPSESASIGSSPSSSGAMGTQASTSLGFTPNGTNGNGNESGVVVPNSLPLQTSNAPSPSSSIGANPSTIPSASSNSGPDISPGSGSGALAPIASPTFSIAASTSTTTGSQGPNPTVVPTAIVSNTFPMPSITVTPTIPTTSSGGSKPVASSTALVGDQGLVEGQPSAMPSGTFTGVKLGSGRNSAGNNGSDGAIASNEPKPSILLMPNSPNPNGAVNSTSSPSAASGVAPAQRTGRAPPGGTTVSNPGGEQSGPANTDVGSTRSNTTGATAGRIAGITAASLFVVAIIGLVVFKTCSALPVGGILPFSNSDNSSTLSSVTVAAESPWDQPWRNASDPEITAEQREEGDAAAEAIGGEFAGLLVPGAERVRPPQVITRSVAIDLTAALNRMPSDEGSSSDVGSTMTTSSSGIGSGKRADEIGVGAMAGGAAVRKSMAAAALPKMDLMIVFDASSSMQWRDYRLLKESITNPGGVLDQVMSKVGSGSRVGLVEYAYDSLVVSELDVNDCRVRQRMLSTYQGNMNNWDGESMYIYEVDKDVGGNVLRKVSSIREAHELRERRESQVQAPEPKAEDLLWDLEQAPTVSAKEVPHAMNGISRDVHVALKWARFELLPVAASPEVQALINAAHRLRRILVVNGGPLTKSGDPHGGVSAAVAESDALKAAGVEVVTFGVGERQEPELRQLATRPKGGHISVESINDVADVQNALAAAILHVPRLSPGAAFSSAVAKTLRKKRRRQPSSLVPVGAEAPMPEVPTAPVVAAGTGVAKDKPNGGIKKPKLGAFFRRQKTRLPRGESSLSPWFNATGEPIPRRSTLYGARFSSF